MITLAFFNNKGGVGKTSLVYHLSWMFAEMGLSALAVDLDPQANLTSMFLNEDRLKFLWDDSSDLTISDFLEPLRRGRSDIAEPVVEHIREGLGLVPGNLALSRFEDALASAWGKCLEGDERSFLVMTSFHRIIAKAARLSNADIVLIDVGPNLGAINRAALIAAHYVVLPLAPDLFSLQGLKNLGPTIREDWRKGWDKRLKELPKDVELDTPQGRIQPIGYVVMQHGIRDSRPVKSYQQWMDRIPETYRTYVLEEQFPAPPPDEDPYRLALLKHYRSLMPMAMEAHKPIFLLMPADGAIGSHTAAVKACRDDFERLARKIAATISLPL